METTHASPKQHSTHPPRLHIMETNMETNPTINSGELLESRNIADKKNSATNITQSIFSRERKTRN
jgi:hypothetical protein